MKKSKYGRCEYCDKVLKKKRLVNIITDKFYCDFDCVKQSEVEQEKDSK